ncbi:MAG TPA: DUF4160 domain-containing protein [Terriglobia bacterium]|nr:DUF4160 domain-containing protein [Terriglobia bacterium]
MPTILRSGPYRFFFYSADRDEPPHIHVEREAKTAKFWLDPVRIQSSGGFARAEIAAIERLVRANAGVFLRSWNEFFEFTGGKAEGSGRRRHGRQPGR